jgi:hypothetical protein
VSRRTRSSRHSESESNSNYTDDELIDYSVFDHITKKPKIEKSGSNKFFSLVLIVILSFSAFLALGVFSPEKTDPNTNSDAWSIDITDGGNNIPVVLYSSPTCGCCHKYVNYLDDNGFDTFQKRTEDYENIKDENNIPDDLRSCHTAIIGDYFVEGHIPVQVVYDMINSQPDLDGIALPEMPSGSPGMDGDKLGSWDIYKIQNGENTGIFQTL